MKVIVLLGPPGSGKGTAAERLKERLGLDHVSTGDMLREAVRAGTPAGKEAERCMQAGELVADEIIMRLVEERMAAGGAQQRYLFDGFPRTVRQAELLESVLERRNGALERVLSLEAPRDVLVSRLTGRRTCRRCGTNFHVRNIPPRQPGICDACGGDLYQRPDDNEATILNRLAVYNRQTESLIARYASSGVLVHVATDKPLDEMVAELVAALDGPARAERRA